MAERLRLKVENDHQLQQQKLHEEQQEAQKQEEQKKRWMALRGNASPVSSKTSNSCEPHTDSSSEPIKSIGRGRGRGAVMVNNLRRPGEKSTTASTATTQTRPPPGFGRSLGGVGRGTKLHASNNLSNNLPKYAATSTAPHPSEAPNPPRAWMG